LSYDSCSAETREREPDLKMRAYNLLHLAGVILFFAGFFGALLSQRFADRTHDSRIVAHTFRVMNFNDRWLTPVAIILILLGGFGAASRAGLSVVGTGWIFWSLVLFGISGVIFLTRALPLQLKIENLARRDPSEFDWDAYGRLSRSWSRWAQSAFVAVLVALVLMVLRPHLPVP
jgi:uncharacterized membrane protein